MTTTIVINIIIIIICPLPAHRQCALLTKDKSRENTRVIIFNGVGMAFFPNAIALSIAPRLRMVTKPPSAFFREQCARPGGWRFLMSGLPFAPLFLLLAPHICVVRARARLPWGRGGGGFWPAK